jgi:hypothetical protein
MTTLAESLRNAPQDRDDYVAYLTELLDSVDPDHTDDATFFEAFQFIERNAQAELGTPGPLVHFLERHHPRHCRHLVESVRRHPTSQTVWMLNRLLNGRPADRDRAEILELLASVANTEHENRELRLQARRFYERHAPAS